LIKQANKIWQKNNEIVNKSYNFKVPQHCSGDLMEPVIIRRNLKCEVLLDSCETSHG